MSRSVDSLSRAHTDLNLILKDAAIDLALSRAEAWSVTSSPFASHDSRGGSSSPTEAREKAEIRKVIERATGAVLNVPRLVKQIEEACRQLRFEVAWLTATVDPSQLPPADPECKSCRREGEKGTSKIGNHFAPVYEKAKSTELCRWCWGFENEYGQLPPIEACDLRHTQSPEKAGRWLAQWIRDNSRRKAS